MLKDMAFEVSKRRCKNSIGQMFSIQIVLVKKTLLKWFNQKFKQQFDKIDPFQKIKYERQHSIDWENYKCVICRFPLKLEPTNYKTHCIGLLALLNNYHRGDCTNYDCINYDCINLFKIILREMKLLSLKIR